MSRCLPPISINPSDYPTVPVFMKNDLKNNLVNLFTFCNKVLTIYIFRMGQSLFLIR